MEAAKLAAKEPREEEGAPKRKRTMKRPVPL